MALGRGLEELLADNVAGEEIREEGVAEVAPDRVEPSPLQPRKSFEPGAIEGLAASIREHGLLQPLIVRRKGERFELIAGERRWRAARQAGLDAVPVRILKIDDAKLLQLALIENLQREDLNPIEKARAFRELKDRFGMTQEQVAARIGMDRSSVANLLRLLDLPEKVQSLVESNKLSMGHARAILSLEGTPARTALAERAAREQLSVRATEAIAAGRDPAAPPLPPPPKGNKDSGKPMPKSATIQSIEARLRERLGRKATIVESKPGRGQVRIEFYSPDDFEVLLSSLGVPPDTT